MKKLLVLSIVLAFSILLVGLVYAQNETCTDSDGGKNYYESGKAYSGENIIYDKCIVYDCKKDEECVPKLLKEAVCGLDNPTDTEYQCEYKCINGACIPA